MSEKIPPDALLPIALELYRNLIKPLEYGLFSRPDRISQLMEAADDFATFYNRLRDGLENPVYPVTEDSNTGETII